MATCTNCGRRFPIVDGPSLPWAMLLPHERQAKANHDQSLETLASRGGLACYEALAVLDDRKWKRMDEGAARAELSRRLAAWEDNEERAAHARTRAELAAAKDLLAAVASGVDVYEYASDPPGQWAVSDDRTGRFLGANGWVDEPEDAASFPTADAAFAALAAARKETT